MTRRLRLRRLSSVMAVVCLAMIALLLLGQAAIWFLLDPCHDWWAGTAEGTLPHDVLQKACNSEEAIAGGGLPLWKQVGGFVVALIPAAVAVYGLVALYRLFRLYAAGQVFTPGNTRMLRRFALAVFGYALAKPLAMTLTVLVFTIDAPPSQRQLTIGFSQAELTALFLGLLFLAIAWVMDEARALAEEHAQIV